MALSLGGLKKKKDRKMRYSILSVSLMKPGKKKFAEFDYEDSKRLQLKESDSSADDERFHDRDAMDIIRRLEEKYGKSSKSKKRKKLKLNEDDFIDKQLGYDVEDEFIDDSEMYDELIPSTMEPIKGGFYINKGPLKFKNISAEVEDDSDDDEDDVDMENDEESERRAKKRPHAESEQASEESSSGEAMETEVNGIDRGSAGPSRMVGAPPTKKNLTKPISAPSRLSDSGAFPKRMVGAPPTMKNKVINAMKKTADELVDSQFTNSQSAVRGSPTPEDEDNDSDVEEQDLPLNTPSSPTKKQLPNMSSQLRKMYDELLNEAGKLAPPGSKRRLQQRHVDMVLAIEDQCIADRLNSHEKGRILYHIADFCGIQKNSLYVRLQKRREELRNQDKPSEVTVATSTSQPTTSTSSKPEPVRISVALPASVANEGVPKGTPEVKPLNPIVDKPSVPAAVVVKPPAPSAGTSTSTAKPPVPLSTKPVQNSKAETSKPSSSTAKQNGNKPEVSVDQIMSVIRPYHPTWTNENWKHIRRIMEVATTTLSSAQVVKLVEGCISAPTPDALVVTHSQLITDALAKVTAANAAKTTTNGVQKSVVTAARSSPVTTSSACNSNTKFAPSQSINRQPTKQPQIIGQNCLVTLARALELSLPKLNDKPTKPLTQVEYDELHKHSGMLRDSASVFVSHAKVEYVKKVEASAKTGAPTPPKKLKMDASLYKLLATTMDELWDACHAKAKTSKEKISMVYNYLTGTVYEWFKDMISLSDFLIEYVRCSPHRAYILTHEDAKALLAKNNVDLTSIYILPTSSFASKSPTSTQNKAPSKSNSEIQNIGHASGPSTSSEQPSTSTASAVPAAAESANANCAPSSSNSASKPSPSTSSKPVSAHSTAATPSTSGATSVKSASPSTSSAQNATTKTPQMSMDLANMQKIMTSMGITPNSQLTAVQQAMFLQLMQMQAAAAANNSTSASINNPPKIDKQKLAEEKEKRRKEKEDAKMKLKEEKRKQIEEEKRKKAEEKAKKIEEERLRRQKEQEEREKRLQEERDRKQREEEEKRRREEEEKKLQEQLKAKLEEEQKRREQEQLLARIREEEAKATAMLEEEVALDDGEETEELASARQEAERAEQERIRQQQEAAAAARAAALAAQERKPMAPPQPEQKPLKSVVEEEKHSDEYVTKTDVKPFKQPQGVLGYPQQYQQQQLQQPPPHQVSHQQQPQPQFQQQQGMTGCIATHSSPAHQMGGFASPQSSMIRSPANMAPVPNSPQYGRSPFFAGPSSVEGGPVPCSPQMQMQPSPLRTPPAPIPQSPRNVVSTSPLAFHQQQRQHQYQQQQVQGHIQQSYQQPLHQTSPQMQQMPNSPFTTPSPIHQQHANQFHGSPVNMQQQQQMMQQQNYYQQQQQKQQALMQEEQLRRQQDERERQRLEEIARLERAEAERRAEQARLEQERRRLLAQEDERRRQEEKRRQDVMQQEKLRQERLLQEQRQQMYQQQQLQQQQQQMQQQSPFEQQQRMRQQQMLQQHQQQIQMQLQQRQRQQQQQQQQHQQGQMQFPPQNGYGYRGGYGGYSG